MAKSPVANEKSLNRPAKKKHIVDSTQTNISMIEEPVDNQLKSVKESVSSRKRNLVKQPNISKNVKIAIFQTRQ